MWFALVAFVLAAQASAPQKTFTLGPLTELKATELNPGLETIVSIPSEVRSVGRLVTLISRLSGVPLIVADSVPERQIFCGAKSEKTKVLLKAIAQASSDSQVRCQWDFKPTHTGYLLYAEPVDPKMRKEFEIKVAQAKLTKMMKWAALVERDLRILEPLQEEDPALYFYLHDPAVRGVLNLFAQLPTHELMAREVWRREKSYLIPLNRIPQWQHYIGAAVGDQVRPDGKMISGGSIINVPARTGKGPPHHVPAGLDFRPERARRGDGYLRVDPGRSNFVTGLGLALTVISGNPTVEGRPKLLGSGGEILLTDKSRSVGMSRPFKAEGTPIKKEVAVVRTVNLKPGPSVEGILDPLKQLADKTNLGMIANWSPKSAEVRVPLRTTLIGSTLDVADRLAQLYNLRFTKFSDRLVILSPVR